MAETVTVEVAGTPTYTVIIGADLDPAEEVSRFLESGVCAVLTDSNVGPLHAESVTGSLKRSGWRVADVIEILAGESLKDLSTYGSAIRRLARSGLTRDGTLFVLGGGVVGDLGGFVAGTFMRGINLVALPTSLLAMVDSSVGGKVGVDLPEGKNLVGTFVRPRAVVANLGWLRTLPKRELSNGLAEVIKMGLLCGGEYLIDLNLIDRVMDLEPEALLRLVVRPVRFKAEVVAEDEFESGRRAILNYGHTIGHGLEAVSGYAFSHGEAVGVGMVAAAGISEEKLGTTLKDLHEDLLLSAGLPVKTPRVSVEKVLAAMGRDKKRRASDSTVEHRFVLLEDVGRPLYGVRVGEDEVRRAIEAVVE
ncbi:MAG: 3-dehydroquinate synthase [Rubrobacteraceae bacterium]